MNILEAAGGKRQAVVGFLRDLLAIPGTSCEEGDVCRRVVREMEALNFDEVRIDEMGNVIGRVGTGPVRMVFDSHLDTVGIGDRDAWPHDPYTGKYAGGVVYGRGASDNRGATACQVYGAALGKELGLIGKGASAFVVGTVMEEDCDGLALQHILQDEISNVEAVVLGECTDLAIYRGHRGRTEIKIEVSGKACHASAPERGVNAIYKMQPIIRGVEKLGAKLADDPFLGKGTVAVTSIECMTASLNAVPDRCTIYLDRRLTRGETVETALAELRALEGASGARVEVLRYDRPSWTGYKLEVDKYFPTWVLEEDHPLVQAGFAAGQDVLGRKPRVDKWTFSTNGIASMGRLGIPTIGFGPSKEEWAHSVWDQCPDEDLVKSIAFYALFPGKYVERRKRSS